jgi:antitoxin component of MazEF toxin-antitoxin module
MSAIQKICRRGNAQGITIPKHYLSQLGWLRGEYVHLTIQGDIIVLGRVAPVVTRPALKGFKSSARGHGHN